MPVPTAAWRWRPSEPLATPTGASSFNIGAAPWWMAKIIAGARIAMADVVTAEVSVRNLKTRLSEWLGRVQAGEVVEVTTHRKPITRIACAACTATAWATGWWPTSTSCWSNWPWFATSESGCPFLSPFAVAFSALRRFIAAARHRWSGPAACRPATSPASFWPTGISAPSPRLLGSRAGRPAVAGLGDKPDWPLSRWCQLRDFARPAARTSPLSWNAHQALGHTWRLRHRLFGACRNHNQTDNANNIGFRVVCLPQHPSPSEPLEGIPAGAQEGSRLAPEIGDPGKPGLPRPCRRTIRTAPFFSRQS